VLASRVKMSISQLVKRVIMDLEWLRDEVHMMGFEAGFESALEEVEKIRP